MGDFVVVDLYRRPACRNTVCRGDNPRGRSMAGSFKDGIRREANGTYSVKVGRRWSRGHRSKVEARKARYELQERAQAPSQPVTVDSFAARWVDEYPRPAESTNQWYRDRIKAVGAHFKGRRLSSITREEAYRWSRSAQPHQARAAATMFGDAVRYGIDGLQSNPFQNLRLPQPKGRSEIIPLTSQEVAELANIAIEVHGEYGRDLFAPMILVAAWTGLRPGEMYPLTPEDIDWRQGLIHVTKSLRSKTQELVPHTKNYDRRTVPIAPVLLEPLRGLSGRSRNGLLFTSKRGKRLMERTFSYYWHPVRQRFAETRPEGHWLSARIAEKGEAQGNLDAYELRHALASELMARGASKADLAAILGHRDESTVPVYAHQRPGEASERVRRLLA
jgi:integrase